MSLRRLLVLVKGLSWVKVQRPGDRSNAISSLARLVGMGVGRSGRNGRSKGDISYTPKRR